MLRALCGRTFGIGAEHAPDQLGDHRTGLLQQRPGELGPPVDLVAQRLLEGARRERTGASDGRVDRRGERVDVAARVGRLALELLGRREAGRAEHREFVVELAGDLLPAKHARQAEVDQLGLRLAAVGLRLAHDHVARLDVLVDKAQRVDVVERARQLHEDLDDVLAGRTAQVVGQGLPGQQLLREVHASRPRSDRSRRPRRGSGGAAASAGETPP